MSEASPTGGRGAEVSPGPDFEEMRLEELRERAGEAGAGARERMIRKGLIWALRGD